MQSDIKLKDDRVEVEGKYLQFKGVDFLLDNTERRGTRNRTRPRRALVHDFQDGLTINWANDYPGGVTINNGKIVNPTLEGTIKATEVITAEKGIDIKIGLTVKGGATVEKTLTAKDIRLVDLGFETRSSGRGRTGLGNTGLVNVLGNTGGHLGEITGRPKSLVDVIKEMERKIAALERKIQQLENG